MKKLIIVTIIAAFFAACGNNAGSASAKKVGDLNHWVDSIQKVAAADTACNATTWSAWDATFQEEVKGINEAELAEADKTAFAAAKTNWTTVGTDYTACIKKVEDAKAAAAALSAMDTTKVMAPPTEAPVEMKKEEAKKH